METHKRVLQVSSLALVLLLAGCDMFKGGDKKAASTSPIAEGALITEGGKTVLTVEDARKEFEPIYEKAMEQNGQMKMFAQLTPNFKEQMFANFCKGKVKQMVLGRYIKEKGFDKDPEYKKELDTFVSNVKQYLDVQFIIKKHPITVTPDDIKKYFEEHKEEFLISHGGTLASGVSFDKEADAKAFLTKAQAAGDLKKVADKEGLSARYRSFGAVGAESPLDATLRTAIMKMKKFPSTELVKANDKTFYVVRATGTEGQKYASLDEVKGQLEKMLLEKKLDETLTELGNSYSIIFNEEVIAPKPAAEEAKDMPAQTAQATPEAAKPVEEQAPAKAA